MTSLVLYFHFSSSRPFCPSSLQRDRTEKALCIHRGHSHPPSQSVNPTCYRFDRNTQKYRVSLLLIICARVRLCRHLLRTLVLAALNSGSTNDDCTLQHQQAEHLGRGEKREEKKSIVCVYHVYVVCVYNYINAVLRRDDIGY